MGSNIGVRCGVVVLAAGLAVFSVGVRAQTCVVWDGSYSSAQLACNAVTGIPGGSVTQTLGTTTQTTTVTVTDEGSPGGVPTALCNEHVGFSSSEQGWCAANPGECGEHDTDGMFTVTGSSGACPTNPCAAQAGTEAFVGGGSSPGLVCSGGCEVDASVPTTEIHGGGGSGGNTIYQSSYTGNQCTAPSAAAQCVSGGGVTACGEKGKNCGTFNGDEVCPQSLPPGTCESFASGGVACTAASGATAGTAPPDPDNGTAGTPATPAGQVQVPSGNTANYYTSSEVNSSSVPVSGTPGKTNSPVPGSGAGAPSAANGDCGADGVNCTGEVPNTDDSDGTFGSVAQGFWDSIQTTPIVVAVQSLESAWPGGACFSGLTIEFATVPGHTYDYGTIICNIWDTYAAPTLSAVSLVAWALMGVFILLSA